jgi:hypothetical protein
MAYGKGKVLTIIQNIPSMKSETDLPDGHKRNYQRINKVSSATYFTFILHPSETFHDNHFIFSSSAARARQMMIYLCLS